MSPLSFRLSNNIDGYEMDICFFKYVSSKLDFIECMYVVNKLLSAVAYIVKKHTAN